MKPTGDTAPKGGGHARGGDHGGDGRDDTAAPRATLRVWDDAACARVQAGLESGLIHRLRLTPLEAPIADFQRWVAARTDVAPVGHTGRRE